MTVLLSAPGSGSLPDTETVRLNPPVAVGLRTKVTVAFAPLAKVLSWQFTVAVPVHEPCEEETETNVAPVGSEMFICTPAVEDGPLLVIVAE